MLTYLVLLDAAINIHTYSSKNTIYYKDIDSKASLASRAAMDIGGVRI